MASYVLPLPESGSTLPGSTLAGARDAFPESLLLENALWFCRLRWIIVAVLTLFGVLGMLDSVTRRLFLVRPGIWPFVAAGIVAAANGVYLTHARFLRSRAKQEGVLTNLWSQIVLDLVILTGVVHFLGSTNSYVPFVYLFHIVLACSSLPRNLSFLVTVLAAALFAACVFAELMGILSPVSIFSGDAPKRFEVAEFNLLSAIGIWMVVWHLASRLWTVVRQRDIELAMTNRSLVAAREERSRHMLTTTHQLKAPFAAIHANAQLLLDGYCGALSDEALDVVRRISIRCRRLAAEIHEMLQLANLSSDGQQALDRVPLDLAQVLRWCIRQVETTAQVRRISLQTDIQPAQTLGVEDHLKMLFLNLLANAVTYSLDGGEVRVRCVLGSAGEPTVTIADDGIGIVADKLPRIFEEYYRTTEAVQHNKETSGLGLAIVKRVVESHRVRVHVQSSPGAGTTFELRFPLTDDSQRRST